VEENGVRCLGFEILSFVVNQLRIKSNINLIIAYIS